MKTIIYNGTKITPKIQKANGIVFYGTDAGCESFYNRQSENIQDALYINSLSRLTLNRKNRLEDRPVYIGNYDNAHCIVICAVGPLPDFR